MAQQQPQQEKDDLESRTTAFGIWRNALEYLKAARILASAQAACQSGVCWDVTYQCACQGLELAFKAYERAHGTTLDDLKRLGHSIEQSMQSAFSHGLPQLETAHIAAIKIANELYANHEFRYIRTGVKRYPEIETLLDAGIATLLATAPPVAAISEGRDKLIPPMRRDVDELRQPSEY